MNISNLIIRLQELADASTNTFELMILAKAIEKAKVGAVRTVATFGDLPALPLAEDGELFLVEADEDIYFNVGTTWDRFRPFEFDAMGWGRNNYGQLGDGTRIFRSSPVTVVGGITNWSDISIGFSHSLGVANGIAYAWGGQAATGQGRLGDGTIIDRSSPVTVVGGITNWSKVSAGNAHSLGLTDTGIVYAWGVNGGFGGYGQLGDGTPDPRSSPVTVAGGITNWSDISAGTNHNLALTDTGVLYSWGDNNRGQIGDGTRTDRSSPVTVVGGITNWSAISAGNLHNLGLTDTGILYAWGYGGFGRLGTNDTIHRSSPVTVVGGITNWSSISAGNHSLALTDAGVLYAWGPASDGKLGGGDGYIHRSSPVTVVGGITNWSQISAGHDHSLGIAGTGITYAWGDGDAGALGDGTIINKSSPVTVVGGITNWSQISSGRFNNSLAIKTRV